jgi:hypothetical protein
MQAATRITLAALVEAFKLNHGELEQVEELIRRHPSLLGQSHDDLNLELCFLAVEYVRGGWREVKRNREAQQ